MSWRDSLPGVGGVAGSMEEHFSTLRRGADFQKLHKFGRTKKRHVWCTDDMGEICWGIFESSTDPRTVKGSIAVADVRTVLVDPKFVKGSKRHLALSIVTELRKLNLIAPTQESRDKWAQLFQFLVKMRQREGEEEDAKRSKLDDDIAALGPSPLADDVNVTLQALVEGFVFDVYKKGVGKSRTVRVTLPLDALCWTSLRSSTTHVMGLHEIESVRAGAASSDFPEDVEPSHCFAVIGEHNRLCVDARNKSRRDWWVYALRQVVSIRIEAPASGIGVRERFLAWLSRQPGLGNFDAPVVAYPKPIAIVRTTEEGKSSPQFEAAAPEKLRQPLSSRRFSRNTSVSDLRQLKRASMRPKSASSRPSMLPIASKLSTPIEAEELVAASVQSPREIDRDSKEDSASDTGDDRSLEDGSRKTSERPALSCVRESTASMGSIASRSDSVHMIVRRGSMRRTHSTGGSLDATAVVEVYDEDDRGASAAPRTTLRVPPAAPTPRFEFERRLRDAERSATQEVIDILRGQIDHMRSTGGGTPAERTALRNEVFRVVDGSHYSRLFAASLDSALGPRLRSPLMVPLRYPRPPAMPELSLDDTSSTAIASTGGRASTSSGTGSSPKLVPGAVFAGKTVPSPPKVPAHTVPHSSVVSSSLESSLELSSSETSTSATSASADVVGTSGLTTAPFDRPLARRKSLRRPPKPPVLLPPRGTIQQGHDDGSRSIII